MNASTRNFVFLLMLAPIAAGAEDARAWLDRMSQALQTLDYEGTLVYMHGGQLESMRILHRVDAEGERERLISLNGAAREVLRDNEKVTCILPDDRAVVVDKSHPRVLFPAALPSDLDTLSRNYAFNVIGEDRVAGMPVRIIGIQPKDEFRYGYRLWLDSASSMLLKSDLIDARGVTLEQRMFTSFTQRSDIADAELAPGIAGKEFTRYDGKNKGDSEHPQHILRWQVTQLPAGFMLTHSGHHQMPAGGEPVEHMVYSDGLATVSVYVDGARADTDMLEGLSSMGALNAFGLRKDSYHVTAVGEVPAATVQLFARSALMKDE